MMYEGREGGDMSRLVTRRAVLKRAAVLGAALPMVPALLAGAPIARAGAPSAPRAAQEGPCRPEEGARPVCPGDASSRVAAFVDPTVQIEGAEDVSLGRQVYVGPFAQLLARDGTEIRIGDEANVQDGVTIYSRFDRDTDVEGRIAALGLDDGRGVEIGRRCVLEPNCTVKGPAQIGVIGSTTPDPDDEPGVFLSLGCEVDGAILERNTGLSALSRVGPGVRLRSGFVVLPGYNITTQEEADDVGLGKVRSISEADARFNRTVIEVNTALAREYAVLAREDPANVRGINYNPGNTSFTPQRRAPTLAGVPSRVLNFPNRVIGDVSLADSLDRLTEVMAALISLRADDSEPFRIGRIRSMESGIVVRGLEDAELQLGDDVGYGRRVVIQAGGRVPESGGAENRATIIEDGVTLEPESIVSRSRIGRGTTIGERTAVIGSNIAADSTVPPRVIFLNNRFFAAVEW